jgi:hypothetical protein
MLERVELTQEKYLEAMQVLGFTPEQIEENRRHHGGSLHLSDDVALAALFDGCVDGVGVSVDPVSGEMVLSKVVEDLGGLAQAFNSLVDQAFAKFSDPRNPDHATAMIDFLDSLSGRIEEIRADAGLRARP